MKRLLQAWGGTLLGTIIGFSNAVAVTRRWSDGEAADFFLVPVIILALSTVAEFGLGALSVHDVARIEDAPSRQAYVNAALATSARRSIVPAIIGGAIAAFAVGLDLWTSSAVAAATTLTTVAIAGQPLLRGLDRRGLASVGGAVAATILTGAVVIPLALADSTVSPLIGALIGYSLAGLITAAVLVRPAHSDGTVDRALLTAQRSRYVAGHNVAHMAGRQVDTMLAGSFMSDLLFTSYSVMIRMAAPLGLITFAANQSVARDMHRILDGDVEATEHAATMYRWSLLAAAVAAVGLVALGPAVGGWVFGDTVEIRRSFLLLIGSAYLVSVAGAAGGMLLAAGDKTVALLRTSLSSLAVAGLAAGAAVAVQQSTWAAPLFVSTWLVLSTSFAARAVRKELNLSTWAPSFGPVEQPERR